MFTRWNEIRFRTFNFLETIPQQLESLVDTSVSNRSFPITFTISFRHFENNQAQRTKKKSKFRNWKELNDSRVVRVKFDRNYSLLLKQKKKLPITTK